MELHKLSLGKWAGVLKKYQYFFLILVVGILFMAIPSDKKDTEVKKAETVQGDFDLTAFEKKLEDTIGKVEGAGDTKLVLTLKSSTEAIYATDTRGEDQSISVISTDNYGQEPVLIKKVYPEFQGAAVVCNGGDDARVRLKITELLMSVCDISSKNISISKMTS